MQLVKAGQLRNALLIHEYFPVHCRFETIKEAYNAYESIPQDVIGNDLKQWLVTDLVPSLFTSYDDTYTDNDTGNQSEVLELGKLPVILKICVNLVDWAREFEDVDQNPIQALVVINCAAQILTQALGLTSVLPSWEKSSTHITESQSIKPNFTYLTMKEIYSVPKVSMTSIDSIVQSVFSTQLSLQLQREIWFLWSFKLRFIEIERSGIQSIVYKRLWLVPNDAIELELTDNIAPVLRQCGLSIDHVLEGWIREALQTRVVTCKSGVDSSMFDGNNSTEGDLNKLVLVAKLIMNPHSKAHAVLSLLQVPVVTSLDSGSDDDDSDDSNIDLGERKREQQRVLVEAHKHCIDALCEAAHALCSVVDSKTNDLLVESLRLQRIKTLAFQYGVDTFDPRDYKQVRAVAGLIASHVESPSSIPDAIEIVQAWSAGGFDISGFLTRALVHRASYQPVGPSEERGHIRKRLLASALKLVPSMKLKVVVESTINCLTQILEDICDDNDNADTDDDAENENQPYFGELSTSEDQERYSVCCESALYILSWYLDEKKGLPESPLYSFNSHSNTVGSMLASTDNHDSGDASDTLISNSSFPLSLSGDTSTLFSCVHYGTLVMLKRLRHTQREFGLYLPPTAVNDTEVCKEVVGRIAEQHVEELLELIPKACDVVQAAAIVESDVLVTLRHRRICAALNVSLVYFSHRTVKCLFGNNQKV